MSSLIFIGPPGAGKGTQIKQIIKKYDIHPIMLGELMRAEVKAKTSLGLQIQSCIDKGLLAPHELAMQITEQKIKEYHYQGFRNILFDGFPREMAQALALEDLLQSSQDYAKYKIKCVILFKVSNGEIVNRIHKRCLTSGRADDADDEVIKRRIDIFYDNISSVIERYKKLGLLEEINGEQDKESVSKDIDAILSQRF